MIPGSRLSWRPSPTCLRRRPFRALTFEPLEDRLTPSGSPIGAAVQFTTAGQSVDVSAGAFRLTVTLLGNAGHTFVGGFDGPDRLAFDAAGNLYVSNLSGSRVDKVTPAGAVSTFVSGVSSPRGLAFDGVGNLYVAVEGAGTVEEVTPAGTVSTFATGLTSPIGLAFDRAGNLYVAEETLGAVAKVTPAGVVSTFATGFDRPTGLAFDSAGKLYVANFGGVTVSKVAPDGSVSTFATGLSSPEGLAFDPAGNLYVANEGGNTVSIITPAGQVSPYAIGFNGPVDLAFDPAGTLLVSDFFDGTVSKVSFGPLTLPVDVIVPFSLGGTATAGIDYTSATASPLVIPAGQSSATITGTLLAPAGEAANPTLTATLGTPTNAALGDITTTTLTIVHRPTTTKPVSPAGAPAPVQGKSPTVIPVLAFLPVVGTTIAPPSIRPPTVLSSFIPIPVPSEGLPVPPNLGGGGGGMANLAAEPGLDVGKSPAPTYAPAPYRAAVTVTDQMIQEIRRREERDEDEDERDRLFAALGVGKLYDPKDLFGDLFDELTSPEDEFVPTPEDMAENEVFMTTLTWFVLTTVACEITLVKGLSSS
jgi:sugar lactone lactonase YvrE